MAGGTGGATVAEQRSQVQLKSRRLSEQHLETKINPKDAENTEPES